MQIGIIYSDLITENGQTKWYVFQNPDPGKLTVYLKTVSSSTVDYDLHLFKLNEDTMTLIEQTSSTYGPNMNEQVAKISDGGIYYIAVDAWQGFDVNNPFAFIIQHSPIYDNNEPNDNIWQANVYTNSINLTGTIDNDFDVDWFIFSLEKESVLNTRLSNPANSTYQLDIFDANLNYLASFSENQDYNNYRFQAGTYYMRVIPVSSYDANTNYTLTVQESTPSLTNPVRAEITSINSDGGVEGYIDYGEGKKWRIKTNITINGKLLDEHGLGVPNTKVEFTVTARLNNREHSDYSYTDANGNFSVPIFDISPAIGEYSYSTGRNMHLYDIVELKAESNQNVLILNETSLYHFAYSYYIG